MNNILVYQQYYYDIDLFDVIVLVLQLVERVDHVMNDFLENDIDHVHRYTMKRKFFEK